MNQNFAINYINISDYFYTNSALNAEIKFAIIIITNLENFNCLI